MREGQGGIKKGQGDTLTFTSTWHFLAVTDSKFVSREEVLFTTAGLPFVGITYGLIQAICTGLDAVRRKDNPIYWDVTATFDTGSESQRQSQDDPDSNDPTTWIPVFIVDSFETRDKVLKVDKSPTPKACVNSAKTPFADPLTETQTLCAFSFTQFETVSLTLNDILDRNETTNEDAFLSYPARTLKLNVTKAERGLFLLTPAWRIEYRVTYDRDTWDETRLDVGPTNLIGESCMDHKRMHKIVGNLNGSGVQIYTEPSTLTFRTKTQIAFASFIRTA